MKLVHVAAELLYECHWIDVRGGWCQELSRNLQVLAIDEFCCGRFEVFL
jgi:hypothetical protein